MDDLHFGVHQDMMYARNVPAVQGAQWTGVVTQIAIDMLESGKVDAVICVQNDQEDRFKPKPVSSENLHLIYLLHDKLRFAMSVSTHRQGIKSMKTNAMVRSWMQLCSLQEE